MGTWSYTLGCTTAPHNPSDYAIDIAEWDPAVLAKWRHAAFLNLRDPFKTLWSLPEFMDTGCDAHRLIDHMNGDKLQLWLDLLAYLAKKYPDLEDLTFHFFCTDMQLPYYFSWNRQRDGEQPTILNMHVGNSESIYYFTIMPDPEDDAETCLVFDETAYWRNWRKAEFSTQRLGIPAVSIW